MILNRAKNMMFGNRQVERVYFGTRQIWGRGVPVVWNQLWDNTGENLSPSSKVTTRTDGNVLIITKSGATSNPVAVAVKLTPGHAYFIVGDFFQDYFDGSPYTLVSAKDIAGGRAGTFTFNCPMGAWTSVEQIYTFESTGPWLSARIASSAAAGGEIKIRNMAVVDLTLMFDAGNEPTSTDDPVIAKIKAYALSHPGYTTGTNIIL